MVLELALSEQLFQVKYEQHAHLATSSWLKFLWEKVDMFSFKIVVNNLKLKPPRKQDRWLMAEFARLNYSKHDLLRLNRARLHQQAVFLSDVLCTKGKNIDQRYLIERDRLKQWSECKFPKERPPLKDFNLRRKALYQIALQGRRMQEGGREISLSTK